MSQLGLLHFRAGSEKSIFKQQRYCEIDLLRDSDPPAAHVSVEGLSTDRWIASNILAVGGVGLLYKYRCDEESVETIVQRVSNITGWFKSAKRKCLAKLKDNGH